MKQVPIQGDVKAACEMLDIYSLEIGNECKVLIGVVPQKAKEILSTLRETKIDRNAQIIGEATNDFSEVVLETVVGGKRIMTPPIGDPIPRIC